jgi:hypothetical protein
MEKFASHNPFERQWHESREFFVGELPIKALNTIKNKLTESKDLKNCRSFLIYGKRGSGKSSILKIIENESYEYNSVPVFVNVVDAIADNPYNFFLPLYKQLINKLSDYISLEDDELFQKNLQVIDSNFDESLLTYKEKVLEFFSTYKSNIDKAEKRPINATEIVNDFSEIIKALKVQASNKKIIFLVDEASKIYQNKEIIEIIRAIIQNQIGVTFILAGEIPVSGSQIDEIFGNIKRAFTKIHLDSFNKIKDIKDFFEKNLKSIGWNDKEIKRSKIERYYWEILNITHGKPDLVVQIAAAIYDDALTTKSQKLKLSAAILDGFLEDFTNNSVSLKYKLSNNEEIVLDFNKLRIKFISGLSEVEVLCFKILQSTSGLSTPKMVYSDYKIFFGPSHEMSLNKFESIYKKFVHHKLFYSYYSDKKNNIGFTHGGKEMACHIYLGNHDEEFWLNINFSRTNSYGLFLSRKNYNETFLAMFIGPEASPKFEYTTVYMARGLDSHTRFPTINGFKTDSEFINIDTKGFFDQLANEQDRDEEFENTGFWSMIFDILKFSSENESQKTIELLHIKYINTDYLNNNYLLCFKSPEITSFKITYCEHKYEMFKNMSANSENLQFDYKIEQIKLNELPSLKSLGNLIAKSEAPIEMKSQVFSKILEKYHEELQNDSFDADEFKKDSETFELLLKDFDKFNFDDYNQLNTYCYILIKTKEYQKGYNLLKKMDHKVESTQVDKNLISNSWLYYIKYNLAIVCSKTQLFSEAISLFDIVANAIEEEENMFKDALRMFEIRNPDLSIKEAKSPDSKQIKELCESNIELLKNELS